MSYIEDTDTYRLYISTETIYFDKANGEYFTYGDLVEFKELSPLQIKFLRELLEKPNRGMSNFLTWATRFDFGPVTKREAEL